MLIAFYVFLWWLVGAVSIQVFRYVLKEDFFSEDESFTLNDILTDLAIAITGPIIIPILIFAWLAREGNTIEIVKFRDLKKRFKNDDE